MKKMIAVVLVLTMVMAFASSAMAASVSANFHISTSSTTTFQTGCSGMKLDGTNWWYIELDEAASNLSATHRAVTRVHQGTKAISATWVYSGPNTANRQHTYDPDGSTASYRGRLDDRDSGTLEFHGKFIAFKY